MGISHCCKRAYPTGNIKGEKADMNPNSKIVEQYSPSLFLQYSLRTLSWRRGVFLFVPFLSSFFSRTAV